MMTIDEAIAHAREKAEDNRKYVQECEECAKRKIDKMMGLDKIHQRDMQSCIKCAEEHEQLAEWLEELKRYRDTESAYEQGGKDAVKTFVEKLKSEFEAKLSFEYNLNLNDINKTINDVYKRF